MILKLEPILLSKIWGGIRLGELYKSELENIGECWGISAHEKYSNVINNGFHKGKTLLELFNNNRELFGGYPSSEFPILVKLIDAKSDLSVQVHPNDDYAIKHEKSKGKEECWYVLENDSDSVINIGHKIHSLNELMISVDNDKIMDTLNFIRIEPSDFFYIPSGTLHSIGKGTFILEVSQSSDVTYRVYDYDRVENGVKRELHIKQAKQVISIPFTGVVKKNPEDIFTFDIYNNLERTTHRAHKYGDYIYIISGEGYLDNHRVNKGDFFMVSSKSDYYIEGKLKYHMSNII